MENNYSKQDFNELCEGKSIGAITKDYLRRVETLNKSNANVMSIKTGFEQFDRITGGLHNQNLILLCSRPGIPKETFIINILRKICELNYGIMYFSLALSGMQTVNRFMSNMSGISIQSLNNGNVDEREWDKLVEISNELFNKKLCIYDNCSISVEEITSKCIKMKQANLLDAVVIDSVRNITINGKRLGYGHYTSGDEEWDEVCVGLKNIAKNLDVPIIILADIERRSEEAVFLSDYDRVNVFINEVDVLIRMDPNILEDKERFVDLKVEKNNNGNTGIVKYKFDENICSFYEV